LSQGPPNQGFIQEKAQKWDFLKRTRENWIFFLVLGFYESPEGLER
jgi:hypothetical protein